ncbi:MAG: glycosyltransferase family 1 protein [Bacteroidaceae bacterium]|nr:glycosyltransferase family 1 protein [Bacteroidaceae bacterium]
MKILLIGEYSNVHWTLAEGLRALGHTVCVVSNGDFWKDYKRDISLTREYTRLGGIRYLLKLYALLPRLRGYDIVQLINPMFLELKAERIEPIYRYLKRHNKKIFLGAFGMDAYWVEACTSTPRRFRYSDFNIGDTPISNAYVDEQKADWQDTPKARLNHHIASDCNGIIAGLYEYYAAYTPAHSNKLTYIPFPVPSDSNARAIYSTDRKIRFFIGIQKARSIYKGTDIMLRALERIAADYPNDCEILKAESVPFEQYSKMIEDCDVLLDQLYGYTPAMNALLAMSKGKIVVGGAEPECYELLNEQSLRPMVNVTPSEENVYNQLEWLIKNKQQITTMQQQSIEFVAKHHNPTTVAQRYIEFWNKR